MIVPWSSSDGRLAAVRAAVALQSGGSPRVTFSREAALAFALQASFAGEKCLYAAGLEPYPNNEIFGECLADAAVSVALPSVTGAQPEFGGSTNTCLDKLSTVRSKLDAPLDPAEYQASACAIHYLALRRSLRELVQSARPWGGALDVDLSAGLGLGPLPLILIAVVGSAAIAAFAWYEKETTIEAKRADVAVDKVALETAARVKLATDLAAAAVAHGQAVDIPEVVRSVASAELSESRLLPFAGGLVAAALLAGGVAYALRGKPVVASPELVK